MEENRKVPQRGRRREESKGSLYWSDTFSKWVCTICADGTKVHLGRFYYKEDAQKVLAEARRMKKFWRGDPNMQLCACQDVRAKYHCMRLSSKPKDGQSKIRGVQRLPNGKWQAQITADRQVITLGSSFEEQEQAEQAYLEAAKAKREHPDAAAAQFWACVAVKRKYLVPRRRENHSSVDYEALASQIEAGFKDYFSKNQVPNWAGGSGAIASLLNLGQAYGRIRLAPAIHILLERGIQIFQRSDKTYLFPRESFQS